MSFSQLSESQEFNLGEATGRSKVAGNETSIDINRRINKEIEKVNRKNNLLKDQMIELEQDNETLNNLLVDKENQIFHLQEKLKDLTSSKQ